jgi:acetyl esterase
MKSGRLYGTLVLTALMAQGVFGQQEKADRNRQRDYPPKLEGAKSEVYKTVGDTKLRIYIFEPEGHTSSDKRAAIVFFFGGGWNNGSPKQFEHHCRYLASRGMVAITADYRVRARHGVRVHQCVADAKSALRWVRQHADQLGIDPQRIAAGGGSAGGHLAAATGLIKGFDESEEDESISSSPNAMVLFNPAAALAPFDGSPAFEPSQEKNLRERLGDDPKSLSPAHHVRQGVPPTIIFFGTDDRLLKGAEYMQHQMKSVGSRCELLTWDGLPHGFFNWGRYKNRPFTETMHATDQFLTSLGYLRGEPTIEDYVASQTRNLPPGQDK